MLTLQVARNAAGKARPGGTSVFMSGTSGRRSRLGLAIVSTVTAAMPALIADLALELAPFRVNLIASGFVDTALSASILGDKLDARRGGTTDEAADRPRRYGPRMSRHSLFTSWPTPR